MKNGLIVVVICILVACEKEKSNDYFKLLSYDTDTLSLNDSVSYFHCSFETNIKSSFNLAILDSLNNLFSNNSYINYGDDIVKFNAKIRMSNNAKGRFYWTVKSEDKVVATDVRAFIVQ